MPKGREIHAAGGVIVREQSGATEFVAVHRPRYDDWSLPKGKLEKGETFEDGALREIEEETGLICRLGEELPAVRYAVGDRPKLVRYWLMHPLKGEFAANDEVDELRWLGGNEIRDLLDYEHDARLIDQAEDLIGD